MILLLFLLSSVLAADKVTPSPTPTPFPTLKAWPADCKNQKIYPTSCTSTLLNCGDGYFLNAQYFPPTPCNTNTCLWRCDKGYQFWMVRP